MGMFCCIAVMPDNMSQEIIKRDRWLTNLGLALSRQITKRIAAGCTGVRPGAVIILRSLTRHHGVGIGWSIKGDGIVMGHM